MLRALPILLLGISAACAQSSEEWRMDLDHADPFVRGMAAIGMSIQAPREAGPAVPVLMKTINRKDVGLDLEAGQALVHIGQFHVPALLQSMVADELLSDDLRNAIKHALVAAGPVATRPIVRCMRGPGTHLVGDLGDVLLEIGEPAVAAIVELLVEEQDVRLQTFAAFLLARLGPRARSALPALRTATSSADPDFKSMVQQAISSIQNGSERPR